MTRPGNNSCLVEAEFSVDAGKQAFSLRSLADFAHRSLPCHLTHKPCDNIRVGCEGSAVGMIGCHVDFPRILDQKGEFKSNRPLSCMNSAFASISEGDNSGARLGFYVMVNPLVSGQIVETILKRAVSRHGGCVGEDYLSHV